MAADLILSSATGQRRPKQRLKCRIGNLFPDTDTHMIFYRGTDRMLPYKWPPTRRRELNKNKW